MISEWDQLKKQFSEFSDDELQQRWAAGHLTAAAQSAAESEAASRGLQLAPYQAGEPDDEPDVPPDHDPVGYLGDWELIARNLSPTEAHILCSFLSAHDIPVTPGDTNLVQANWLWSQALGGASIRVPKTLVETARLLLSERRRGNFALDENFDPGEPT